MKVNLINIETEKTTSENLQDEFFGLDPRKDILHRVVTWQLSRKRLGTRKTKSRGEITGSTKKIMRQKGSGGARHRTKKVNLFRGGGTAFGPKVRDHSTKLPKKIRKLGLRHALSAKAAAGELVVLDEASLKAGKSKELASTIQKMGWKRTLFIDGAEVNLDFARAASNIDGVDVLPSAGANVYDILKRDTLVLTKSGVQALEARLK